MSIFSPERSARLSSKLIGYIRYFSGVANIDTKAIEEYQKNRQFHCPISVVCPGNCYKAVLCSVVSLVALVFKLIEEVSLMIQWALIKSDRKDNRKSMNLHRR